MISSSLSPIKYLTLVCLDLWDTTILSASIKLKAIACLKAWNSFCYLQYYQMLKPFLPFLYCTKS